jgi:PKD repeat protein
MRKKSIFSIAHDSNNFHVKKAIFTFFFTLSLTFFGTIGATAQSISGIVNSYAKVTALDTCDQKLTVSNIFGSGFVVGAQVLLIQMNGASMAEENNDTYGALQDMRGAGKYELNIIDSINGNLYYLRYRTLYAYNLDAAIQVVALPTLTTATITDTIRAKSWDGATGGIVVLKANQLTFNAPIVADGAGFRGSTIANAYHDCNFAENPSDFFYAASQWQGAPKGEGINIMSTNKESGRGAQTNGGGGGNSHKTGGGGGGNVRSGGGGGSNNDGGFYCRGSNGGIGGKPITVTNDRLFFGGGGGGAHVNTSVANMGGNGGGIVLVSANSIISNNQFIAANGTGGGTMIGSTPGGGGGGGGTVVVDAATLSGLLSLRANGGAGGSIVNASGRCQGTGGGGAGGRTISNNTAVARSVASGAAGAAFGGTCNGSNNGATAGEAGLNTTLTGTFLTTASVIFYKTLAINTQPTNQVGCEGKLATFTVAVTGSDMRYIWQTDNGSGTFTDLSDNAFYSGSNTATLQLRNLLTIMSAFRFRCVIVAGCNGRLIVTTNAVSVNVTPRPAPSFTYTLGANNNVVYFVNTSTSATRYIWSFGNGNTSTSLSPNNTYLTQGSYTVTLTAINNCDTISTTQLVNVNTFPLAAFASTTTDYCVPANVTYQSQASPNTTSWQWTFPGGSPNTSSIQNPIVQYTQAGVYDALLVVSNPSGRDTLWRRGYIRVNGVPVPSFTYLRNGNIYSFNNPTTGATNFSWDFGDGLTSTQVNPQHNYLSSGTYIVTLRATNSCGTATYTDTILLLNTPTAIVSADRSRGCVPMVVQFNGQNSTNVSSWQWTLTGGTPASSSAQNPRVNYNTTGTFRVQLTVRNSVGQNTTTLDSFIVVENTPNADFTAVVTGNTVQLRNRSTGANSYRWDYDDGTTANRNDLVHDHIYRNGGLYNVSLLALNTACGATTTQQIPVNYVATAETEVEKNSLTLAPNPSNGMVKLHFATPTKPSDELQLLNITGQPIAQWTLSGEQDFIIHLEDLPSGVYVLQYQTGDTRRVRRVVKW